jgi:hypothetical protein
MMRSVSSRVIGQREWATGSSSGWIADTLMPVTPAWSSIPGVFRTQVARAPFSLMSGLFIHRRRRRHLRLVAWA